jgi:hypothetical protein
LELPMKRELFEDKTHSFIVKVWLEETASEVNHTVWRGHITHVPSNQRRYIKDLSEIERFIKPYLDESNVDINC